MPRARKRRWPQIACAYVVLAAVGGTVARLVYDVSAVVDKPIVLRLAVALVVAIVLIHIRRHFRGDPLWDPPSEFADAPLREPALPKLHPDFVRYREEVVNGLGSRSYFERILWPHLCRLAQARDGEDIASEPTFPLPGRWPRRGPTPGALAGLIDRIEGLE